MIYKRTKITNSNELKEGDYIRCKITFGKSYLEKNKLYKISWTISNTKPISYIIRIKFNNDLSVDYTSIKKQDFYIFRYFEKAKYNELTLIEKRELKLKRILK